MVEKQRPSTGSTQEKSSRIVRNTLFLYGQMFVQMLVALLTSRMLFNALGVVDFGIANVIGGVTAVFTVLNNVEGATIRFLTYDIGRERSREEVHTVFSTAQIIHLSIALIVLVLAETAGLYYVLNNLVVPPERLHATLIIYQFSIVAALFAILRIPYEALLIAHERMGAFASFGIVQTLLGVGIVFAVKYADTDKLVLYGSLMLLVQLILPVIYWLYCKRHFAEVAGRWCFDKPLFILMLKFAGWSFNGTLAYMAYTSGVNLLLNAFFGPVMNAARGIAFTVQQKVGDFASKFLSAVNPQIVKSYAAGDFSYLHRLIITASRSSVLLLFILSLPLLLETDTVLRLWLGSVPEYTVAFTRLSLLAIMVETLGRILIMAIQATGKIAKFQMIEANILLLIIPVSYVCLKLGAPPTSVYVTLLVIFLVAQVARVLIVCPAIKMQCWTYMKEVAFKSLLCMVVASILPVAALYLTSSIQPGFWHLVIITVISLLSSCTAAYYIGCDEKMRAFVKNKIRTHLQHGN